MAISEPLLQVQKRLTFKGLSSFTQVVLMSESGGISENLDAGLRNEESQEDRMPASTQPNSRVSVDGNHDVMTLVRNSCVIKPIGSGNCLRKRKPVDGRRSCCGHEWKCRAGNKPKHASCDVEEEKDKIESSCRD